MKNKKTAALFLSMILLLQIPWFSYAGTKDQSAPAERPSICGQIDLERNKAYLASDDGTLSVIDIGNPGKPLQAARLDIPDPGPVTSMLLQNNFVYLLLGDSIQTVDVSEPLEPVWLSRVKIRTDQPAAGMAVDGQRLYLYDNSSLNVFSLADPATTVFQKSISVRTGTGSITDIAVRNGIVYAAMGSEGVHIYFFKDLSLFLNIGKMPDLRGFCEGITMAGEFALFGISEPGQDSPGPGQDISNPDQSLKRIEVMDVADPLNPKHLGTMPDFSLQKGYDAAWVPACIEVRDGYLYLLDELGGFHTVRLDSPIFNQAGRPETAAPNRSKGGKTAYITIDDGPSRNITPKNLDTLKKYGIKATFFVLPREGLDDIYKRILEEGHVIGNHSTVHDYDYLYSSTSNFKSDVMKAHDFIYKKFGYAPTVYRFPGGSMGRGKSVVAARAEILESLGYRYFDWNVSTADTDPNLSKYGTAEKIADILANNVIQNTKGREKLIILMHDSSGKAYTARALPKIIEGLQKQGYEFDVLTNYPDQ